MPNPQIIKAGSKEHQQVLQFLAHMSPMGAKDPEIPSDPNAALSSAASVLGFPVQGGVGMAAVSAEDFSKLSTIMGKSNFDTVVNLAKKYATAEHAQSLKDAIAKLTPQAQSEPTPASPRGTMSPPSQVRKAGGN
jgi:hypothetical protein